MEEKKTEEERQVYRAPVAPDHSCLFTSFAELCLYSKHGDSTFDDAAKLRNVCAEGVLANQEVYCEPILGKSPQDYATWIKNELNWVSRAGCLNLFGISLHCYVCSLRVFELSE